ncbi:hypothetical protein [Psychromicrobium lacuslunae]|uniref:Uncharacterized protein n=1 Tax=Psychromicrobium lacuslunae TaxID=1618207 RepID=A0A0D4BWF3_9MICC|nr:hypothetical protein [Psychromicrobium lacuslunae]AJT40638.1 hypothetical protein UM93_02175 [Psychromicrobium lacuslunae]
MTAPPPWHPANVAQPGQAIHGQTANEQALGLEQLARLRRSAFLALWFGIAGFALSVVQTALVYTTLLKDPSEFGLWRFFFYPLELLLFGISLGFSIGPFKARSRYSALAAAVLAAASFNLGLAAIPLINLGISWLGHL